MTGLSQNIYENRNWTLHAAWIRVIRHDKTT